MGKTVSRTNGFVLVSHLAERPKSASTEFADLASYSKASAKDATDYNVWVGIAEDSNVLRNLRDITAAIIALDENLTQPWPKQIRDVTALRAKLDKLGTFVGSAGTQNAFASFKLAMSDYLGKRLAVTAQAKDSDELREGLAKLNGRAPSLLGGARHCNTAGTDNALRSVQDTLIDYLKHTTAFLK